MHRPPYARETLRFSPLVKTCWADASCIEGVPPMAAGAEPFIFLAGRPAAERAADARAGGIVSCVLKLAIQSGSVRVTNHCGLLSCVVGCGSGLG